MGTERPSASTNRSAGRGGRREDLPGTNPQCQPGPHESADANVQRTLMRPFMSLWSEQ